MIQKNYKNIMRRSGEGGGRCVCVYVVVEAAMMKRENQEKNKRVGARDEKKRKETGD